MTKIDDRAASAKPSPESEPRRSPLRRILDEHPESRPRLARAFAAMLGATIVALAALGALLIWHVKRRGRLIRESLSAPRVVELPELPPRDADRS